MASLPTGCRAIRQRATVLQAMLSPLRVTRRKGRSLARRLTRGSVRHAQMRPTTEFRLSRCFRVESTQRLTQRSVRHALADRTVTTECTGPSYAT